MVHGYVIGLELRHEPSSDIVDSSKLYKNDSSIFLRDLKISV